MKKRWMAALMTVPGIVLIILSYHFWDIPVAHYCRGLSRSVLDIAEIVTQAGDSKWYFMIFVPGFLFFLLAVKNRLWAMRMLFFSLAIAVSGLLNTLLKMIAGRNRPIQLFEHDLYGFGFFGTAYETMSFPSGHSLTVFAVATALTLVFPRAGFVAYPAALAIALSRVVITSHFVSDIIAGALVGTLCTLALKYGFDRFHIALKAPDREIS